MIPIQQKRTISFVFNDVQYFSKLMSNKRTFLRIFFQDTLINTLSFLGTQNRINRLRFLFSHFKQSW